MVSSEFKVRVLEAEEGMVLTQSGDIEPGKRVFADKVYLGVSDCEDNWREITQAEAEELKTLKEAALAEVCKPEEIEEDVALPESLSAEQSLPQEVPPQEGGVEP